MMEVTRKFESISEAQSAEDLRNLNWRFVAYRNQYVPRQAYDLIKSCLYSVGIDVKLLSKGVVDLVHDGLYDEACSALAPWDELGLYDDPVLADVPILNDADMKRIAEIIVPMSDEQRAAFGIHWSPFWNVKTAQEAELTRRETIATVKRLDAEEAW